ncbi:MAG: autotransporter assembly complex family protein [Burkholderiaceae bacterium]
MPRTRRCLRAAASWLAALILAFAAPLPAIAANYVLEIDAPAELRDPLRRQTLLGRWIDEPGFDVDQLPLFIERGTQEAEAIAHAAGFFSARAEVTRQPPATEGGLPTIRIVVDAGARTTVNRFDFELDGPPAAQALRGALVERWPLPEGRFFRSPEWEQGKRLLIDYLQQRGFVRARVSDSRAEVDPELTAAGLRLRIDSGPQLRFGPLRIQGLQRYDRSIVEALRPWSEGDTPDSADPYDFDDLLTFQARLRAAGYFSSVDVLPDLAAVEAEPARGSVPVLVQLTERQTQRAMFGLGFSTDEGPRGLLGYEHRNLLGRGWQLESGLLLQSVRRRVFASVRTPQKSTGHYYQAGARLERLDVQGELVDKQTLFIGEGKRDEEIDRFLSLQYQIERQALPQESGRDLRRALTLSYAWSQRKLDSQIDPRSGYALTAQVSGALKELGSDRSFLRLYARAMKFWPMPKESALAGGLLIGIAELGYVLADSRDGIPSENLFRTGGAQSLRGYGYLALGVPQAGAIVGGRALGVLSLEYQHPIVPNWAGAVFVDVGNAVDRWSDFKPVVGVGGGARWRSPIGPVSLDVAYGEAVRRWRIHLAVGYAF